MRVECEIYDAEIEAESGAVIDGVSATCTRCEHETESFGTGETSVRRCLALMREQCPKGEHNFYITDDHEEA